MSTNLPPLSNENICFALTSFIKDLERTLDLTSLELHYRRAGAYLRALRDVEAIATEEIDGILLIFDRLYHMQFQQIGHLDQR